MLDVMSLRTTPLSLKTFGPLEPSPGNGPAVSPGMVSQATDSLLSVVTAVSEEVAAVAAAIVEADSPVAVGVVESPEPAVDDPLDDPVVEPVDDPVSSSEPQAARATRLLPTTSANTLRRESRPGRSLARPPKSS